MQDGPKIMDKQWRRDLFRFV